MPTKNSTLRVRARPSLKRNPSRLLRRVAGIALLISVPALAQSPSSPPPGPNPGTFKPSEQIEAGSAVSFPVDI